MALETISLSHTTAKTYTQIYFLSLFIYKQKAQASLESIFVGSDQMTPEHLVVMEKRKVFTKQH